MRILWLTENYYPNKGGMAQSCDRITHNLRQQGCFIHILHFTNRKAAFSTEKQHNGLYTALPVDQDASHTLNLAWNHISQLENNYTHLVGWGVNLAVLAGPIFSQWLHIPYIFTIRGNDFDANIFSLRKRESLLYAMDKADAICTVTSQKHERIKSLLPKAKLYYTPNGLNPEDWHAFPSDHVSAQKWRKEIFSDDKILIGIAGILKAKKGLEFFIDSIHKAHATDKVQLLTMGDLTEEGQTYLEQPEIEFHSLPFMESSALIPYYIACDIIAIPSFYEGMPNVLLEAGLLARPFIASNVDGMADVLSEENSFLFSPANSTECKEAIIKLCNTEKEELAKMGTIIQAHISENFTHKKESKRYLKILNKIKA